MVGRYVEHRRGDGLQRIDGLQLVARQLEHEHAGNGAPSSCRASTSSTASPMLPATTVVEPRGACERAGKRGHGGLAVGAGDREHLLVGRQRAREQLDVADELDAAAPRPRRSPAGRWLTPGLIAMRSAPRACSSLTGPVSSGTPEKRAASSPACGGAVRVSATRTRAPWRTQVAHHRQPGLPEAQHDGVAVAVAHQRSFSVDRPNRTSSIVMIQKRTTTWFSFQPLSS